MWHVPAISLVLFRRFLFFFLLSSIWIYRKLICSGNTGLKIPKKKLNICFSEVIKTFCLLSETNMRMFSKWQFTKVYMTRGDKDSKNIKGNTKNISPTSLSQRRFRQMPVPSANQRLVSESHFLFVLPPWELLFLVLSRLS